MVKAVGRSLDMISLLVAAGRPLPVGEVATALELGRTSAYRLAEALADDGWVVASGAPRQYGASAKVLELAIRAVQGLPHRDVLLPFLAELAALVPAQVLLNYYSDGEVIITDGAVAEGGRVRQFLHGRRQLAGLTASGKLLLSFAATDERERVVARGLPPLTPFTKSDPANLLESVTACGKRGYGLADREIDEASSAVAVPVFGGRAEPVAAIGLSLAGPLTPELVDEVLGPALAISRRASAALGNRSVGDLLVS